MKFEDVGCINGTIYTHSGKLLNFENPKAKQITLGDIATGISKQCRYGGQTELWYSVAEHCVLGSQAYSDPEFQLAFLFHDATEAFMGDMPKPLKNLIPQFKEIENRLLNVIYDKWDISKQVLDRVDEIDLRMLRTEKQILFPDRQLGPGLENYLSLDIKLEFWDHFTARHFWSSRVKTLLANR